MDERLITVQQMLLIISSWVFVFAGIVICTWLAIERRRAKKGE